MTVADLITLLQSCPEPGADVSINGLEYSPTGFELKDYGQDGHPVWFCQITVDSAAAYDVAYGRPRLTAPKYEDR